MYLSSFPICKIFAAVQNYAATIFDKIRLLMINFIINVTGVSLF